MKLALTCKRCFWLGVLLVDSHERCCLGFFLGVMMHGGERIDVIHHNRLSSCARNIFGLS